MDGRSRQTGGRGQGTRVSHGVAAITVDERTGRLQRTFALPATPVAVAVDEAAARAFVAVSARGTEQMPDPWRNIPGWVPRELHELQRWLPFLPRPGRYTKAIPPSMVTIDESRL